MKYNGIRSTLPELLAPAGSWEALEAAVLAGADAVYLGGSHFNARMNAQNFDRVALQEAVALAHGYGTRVYLTLNTQVYDRERTAALEAATEAAMCGVDGLIIADMGLARDIHALLPHLPLHASTQFSCHNRYAGKALAPMGFSRFVMAREATLQDLKTSVAESGLEVEVFVHGALCVSHSGQCLFSSLVGGRSGNRGLCAQPCRLPYRGIGGKAKQSRGEQYPLSLKDLSLACHIPALIDSGVASLKIEGRMKSPAYVGGVTAIYRRLLDEGRSATPQEMEALARLFSREGFTDGYFQSNITNAMLGVRTEADKANTGEAEKPHSHNNEAGLPVDMTAEVKAGQPLTLTLQAPLYRQGQEGNIMVTRTVTSDAPEVAVNRPVDVATVQKQMDRLGGTAYRLGELVCHIDDGLMVPMSKLNALRRAGVEALDEARRDMIQAQIAYRCQKGEVLPVSSRQGPTACGISYTASFVNEKQIPPQAKDFFDILYLPLAEWVKAPEGQKPYGVICPPVVFDREVDVVCRRLRSVLFDGARHLLVGNICHVAMMQDLLKTLPSDIAKQVQLHGDFRLNVCNPSSMEGWLQMGLCDVLMSPELTVPRMRDMATAYPQVGGIMYGRVPLMLLEKCVIRALYPDGGNHAPCGKAGEACEMCRQNKAVMVDRMGIKFPVMRTYPHRNVVYNSRPLSMTDRQEVLDGAHMCLRHMIFSVETATQVADVITATQNRLPVVGEVSRMSK